MDLPRSQRTSTVKSYICADVNDGEREHLANAARGFVRICRPCFTDAKDSAILRWGLIDCEVAVSSEARMSMFRLESGSTSRILVSPLSSSEKLSKWQMTGFPVFDASIAGCIEAALGVDL